MSYPYLVIRDTREKNNHGWEWKKTKHCAGTLTTKLDTGDYSLQGMENYVVIERKGSIAEWAKNVTEARFEQELLRLDSIPHAWILLEFNMTDVLNYPVGSGIPRHKWRHLKFRGPFILKRITEMMMNHKVRIVLCGGSGKEVASNIFKRAIEHADTHAAKSKQQTTSIEEANG